MSVAPFAQTASRPLTPTFYQWIVDLHPSLPQVNETFKATAPLNFQIAPVQGFGIERFVAEARDKNSTWDVYVGMTPFVEMSALIKADVIEPWDNYIPKDVLDDIIPSIREECTVDGKLYSWPFLLDIIGMGWNSGQTTRPGISAMPDDLGRLPGRRPAGRRPAGRRRTASPSMRMAGARWRRSRTASAPTSTRPRACSTSPATPPSRRSS